MTGKRLLASVWSLKHAQSNPHGRGYPDRGRTSHCQTPYRVAHLLDGTDLYVFLPLWKQGLVEKPDMVAFPFNGSERILQCSSL
jgi:hypothetical protein